MSARASSFPFPILLLLCSSTLNLTCTNLRADGKWRSGESMRKKMDRYKRVIFFIIKRAQADGLTPEKAIAAIEQEAREDHDRRMKDVKNAFQVPIMLLEKATECLFANILSALLWL